MSVVDRRTLMDTLGADRFYQYERIRTRLMELPEDPDDLDVEMVRIREEDTGPYYIRPRMRAGTYEEHEAVQSAPADLRWALETIRDLCAELDRAADEAGWP